ncbi:hypothetical protein [Rhodococcus qingshengii]|uniref:hypothetical protein n=1 Tax=Rhodococcus qingshengii TaxID=334542 RepID=UPI0021B13147|nr:hypothetical protein [Rhodococcus qingshengii]MCT6735421.1 hypothetical protein [Rhodococcus qingshengii]
MADSTVITNNNGKRFTVRTVYRGDHYGVDDAIVHDDSDDPIIEFYDLDQDPAKFGERGQFVSRYRASIVAHLGDGNFALDGGVPAWTVDSAALAPVIDLAKNLHRSCTDTSCL